MSLVFQQYQKWCRSGPQPSNVSLLLPSRLGKGNPSWNFLWDFFKLMWPTSRKVGLGCPSDKKISKSWQIIKSPKILLFATFCLNCVALINRLALLVTRQDKCMKRVQSFNYIRWLLYCSGRQSSNVGLLLQPHLRKRLLSWNVWDHSWLMLPTSS